MRRPDQDPRISARRRARPHPRRAGDRHHDHRRAHGRDLRRRHEGEEDAPTSARRRRRATRSSSATMLWKNAHPGEDCPTVEQLKKEKVLDTGFSRRTRGATRSSCRATPTRSRARRRGPTGRKGPRTTSSCPRRRRRGSSEAAVVPRRRPIAVLRAPRGAPRAHAHRDHRRPRDHGASSPASRSPGRCSSRRRGCGARRR